MNPLLSEKKKKINQSIAISSANHSGHKKHIMISSIYLSISVYSNPMHALVEGSRYLVE